MRVYPRTHGETWKKAVDTYNAQGLSPYTRGNRAQSDNFYNSTRSIPVHTGKPIGDRISPDPHKVYPRTHGETNAITVEISRAKGLSPYTRGNP